MEGGGECSTAPAVPSGAVKTRKRKDVSDKKRRSEVVIKTCLLSRLRVKKRFRGAFLTALTSRLEVYSKRMNVGSIVLLGLLKTLFAGAGDLSAFQVPPAVFTQTFMRQVIIGPSGPVAAGEGEDQEGEDGDGGEEGDGGDVAPAADNPEPTQGDQKPAKAPKAKPEPLVASYYAEHPDMLEEDTSFLGSRNVWSFGATKLHTAFKNALRTNLVHRIRSFSKEYAAAQEQSKDYGNRLANMIIWGRLLRPPPAGQELREQDRVLVALHRKILGLRDQPPPSEQATGQGGSRPAKRPRRQAATGPIAPTPEPATVAEADATPWNAFQLEDSDEPEVLGRILRYFVHLLRTRKAMELPLFNLSPIFAIKNHFLPIDTSVMYGIARDAGVTTAKSSTAYCAARPTEWARVLCPVLLQLKESEERPGTYKPKEPERCGRQLLFTGTVETDGVALCTHYTKPKITRADQKAAKKKGAQEPPRPIDLSYYRVLGLDPGRTNIFCIAEQNDDGTFMKYTLTRKQYYKESGMTNAEKDRLKWQKGVKEEVEALSLASPKGLDLEAHAQFLAAWSVTRGALWDEFSKKKWGRSRMRVYGGKKRCMARFFNRVQAGGSDPTKEVIIAYGAAGFAPTGKREKAVPTKWALDECRRRFKTWLTDEFRSTRVGWEDGTMLKAVMSGRSGYKVRGLLWCESTIPGRSKFVDRDLNAAINIRRCFIEECTAGRRPEAFTRSRDLPPLGPIVVGKRVRA
jgi:hypothetical protein